MRDDNASTDLLAGGKNLAEAVEEDGGVLGLEHEARAEADALVARALHGNKTLAFNVNVFDVEEKKNIAD
jgi:hypothetical protein